MVVLLLYVLQNIKYKGINTRMQYIKHYKVIKQIRVWNKLYTNPCNPE